MTKYFLSSSMILVCLLFFVLPTMADSIIEVPDKEWDFGELLPGQVVHHSFLVKNNGTTDLIIAEVTPGCGCTTALLLDKIVPPGKSVKIEADLTAQPHDGVMRKSINIVSNDPKSASYIIYLNATVKYDFLIVPNKIEFGEMFIGDKKIFKFVLKPVNKKAFEPSQIIYNKEIFKVEYKPLEAENPLTDIEFSVEYFTAAKFRPRQAFDAIRIYPYKNNIALFIDVPFCGKIRGYILQSAASIFRSVETGKGFKEIVNFKHLKDLPFKILSASSNNPNVTTNIVKISDLNYDIEIILKEGLETKKEDVTVIVNTDQEDSAILRVSMTFMFKR